MKALSIPTVFMVFAVLLLFQVLQIGVNGSSGKVQNESFALASPVISRSARLSYLLNSHWVQMANVTSSDGMANDQFGQWVDISGDTAIISANTADIGSGTDQGAVYIFTRVGSAWIQQQKLIASDAANNDSFGYSVAIEGDIAVVGAHGRLPAAAYVFTRSGGIWTEQQKLFPSDDASQFGVSVAISQDTIIVGSNLAGIGNNTSQGAAYVFVRNGTNWIEQQRLVASDGAAFDFFGHSMAISNDTAVIGSFLSDIGTNTNQGAAYVFVRNGTTWLQQQKITGGVSDNNYGFSVAIDGDTLAVGSNYNGGHGSNAVLVYVRSGASWSLQQILTPSDGAGGSFGLKVSVEGNLAVITSPFDDVNSMNERGSAYVFQRSGSVWTQQQKLIASDGEAEDFFGNSAAISGDRVVIGALVHDVPSITRINKLLSNPLAGANQGAAYFFNDQITTAAEVAIAGKVTDENGKPVFRARVSLVNSNGEARATLTNALGYYSFRNVPVNETYVVAASAKRLHFEPRIINLLDEILELNFTAGT